MEAKWHDTNVMYTSFLLHFLLLACVVFVLFSRAVEFSPF